MAIKKSELYSSLWESCDELRGGMDASQYKDYVLVLLFVKYVSDKYAGQKDALLDVPEGGSFADMVALKGDKEIGDKINKIIAKLAEANDLKGVIDVADFNDADKLGKGKEMVDRLSNLVAIFDNPALDFRGNRAEGDDILGDAYEYLMRHFATESGKSKGQFYTPAEVSRIMAKVIGIAQSQEPELRPFTIRPAAPARCCSRLHDEASRTGVTHLRAGDGQRHRRVGQDEHDPARLPDGGNLAGQHASPARTSRRRDGSLKTVRLRGRQSAVLHQGVEQRLQSRRRRVRTLCLRHPARQERRLRLPAPHPRLAQEHRQRRGHSPARRPLSGQCRSRHPPRTSSRRGYIKGIIGLPGQPLLRHGHSGLHHRARQGKRRTPARASS